MVDSNFFEEVLKIKNLNGEEEVAKYYITEETDEKEKVNFIIKSGYSVQKLALIKNLPSNLYHKELMEYIIKSLLEYIEIWDESLQIEFSNSIYKIFYFDSISDIYNYDFYFNKSNQYLAFINIKESDQKEILRIYYGMKDIVNPVLKFLMKIISTDDKNVSIEYLKSFNIIIKFFTYYKKIKLENDVVDYACNLGTFGKSLISRRYCVFFCSSLIQISENYNTELFNRFMILSSDSDKIIKMETAYNMRFICRELDENFIKRNLLKTIEGYINDDDPKIKSEVLISIIWNFNKFQDESSTSFLNNYIQKLNMFFDNTNDYSVLLKIFNSIISEYFDKLTAYNLTNKNFYNLVKTFLKKFVINNETNIPKSINFIIKPYEGICTIIDHHKETHLLYEILNYIMIKTENNEENNMLFFTYFDKIVKNTPLEILNKLILPKFYSTIDDSIMATYPIFIEQLDKLNSLFNQSEDFQSFFINKFESISNFIQMQINWRIAIKFFDKLPKIDILFNKFPFTTKLFNLVIKFLQDENSNVPLKTSGMKILAYLLKFCKKTEKEEILKFLEKEILDNKCFYVRRLYFPFFEEAIKIFSISTLLNNQIIDNLLRFFNDNKLLQAKLILLLKLFYPLIFSESRLKFIVNSKLDNLKKMGNSDFEISRNIEDFDQWYDNFISHPDSPEYLNLLSKEREKLESEKRINLREQQILNDKKDDLKKLKKNPRKVNIFPIKINETQNKQKFLSTRKDKSLITSNQQNIKKEIIKKDQQKLSDDNLRRKSLNTYEIKEYSINNGSAKKNSNFIDINGQNPRGIIGGSVSTEKPHQNNNISIPKDLNRSINNSMSTEKIVSNQLKDSLWKVPNERKNSTETEKKTSSNNLKIPINMNNIHSFNINVITQTVTNQVNNFINNPGINPNNSTGYIKNIRDGSSNSLINLNMNSNNSLIQLNSNLNNGTNYVQMKKKK